MRALHPAGFPTFIAHINQLYRVGIVQGPEEFRYPFPVFNLVVGLMWPRKERGRNGDILLFGSQH